MGSFCQWTQPQVWNFWCAVPCLFALHLKTTGTPWICRITVFTLPLVVILVYCFYSCGRWVLVLHISSLSMQRGCIVYNLFRAGSLRTTSFFAVQTQKLVIPFICPAFVHHCWCLGASSCFVLLFISVVLSHWRIERRGGGSESFRILYKSL